MYTAMLLGALIAAALVCSALSVFFVRAWQGRRRNREYLVFSALLLALATMTGLEAAFYWNALTPDRPLHLLTMLGFIAAVARLVAPLLLHFALLYVRADYPRRWQWLVYGLTALFVVIALSGGWFDAAAERMVLRTVLPGVELHMLQVELSALAITVGMLQWGLYGVALYLLGRHYWRGPGKSLGALLGTLLLFATHAHDICTALGLLDSPPLMPFGMVALSYGVSLTLITRYGALSRALAVRSRQLDERTKQLHTSVDELTAAHKELERGERMALVGELAAVVSHQVRNPLAVIRNASSSLRKPRLRAQDKAMLHEIVSEELERLRTLVAHLLDYSRPVVPRRVRVDVLALSRRCLAVLRDRSDIVTEVRCSADEGFIEGDPELLLEAFENIASNAGQAMPGGGQLEVRIRGDKLDGEPALALSFEDSGDGMTEEAMEQAHRPFFTTRPTGTGLGLPLVVRIVEAHGGKLYLDSVVSRGTTVTLVLPCVRPQLRLARGRMRSEDRISVLP